MRAVARLLVMVLGLGVGSMGIRERMEARGVISLDDYFGVREAEYASELTPETRHNALELLTRVNAFLADHGVWVVKVSSGWRPPSVNEALHNAAKNSYHISGRAIDLADRDRRLARLFLRDTSLLQKHGLWMEDPGSTPRWIHLDSGDRPDRAVRVFKP